MATLNFKRFSHVINLKTNHPEPLVRFLTPYAPYLGAKEFTLPLEGSSDGFDCEALTSLFFSQRTLCLSSNPH